MKVSRHLDFTLLAAICNIRAVGVKSMALTMRGGFSKQTNPVASSYSLLLGPCMLQPANGSKKPKDILPKVACEDDDKLALPDLDQRALLCNDLLF